MKSGYSIGEDVWIYCGDTNEFGTPIKTKGRVIHAFFTPFQALMQYVVLLPPVYMNTENRTIFTMSPSELDEPAWGMYESQSARLPKTHLNS